MLPQEQQDFQPTVAYFCAEFGITQTLPIYSGGLGILAGDMVKQASDVRLPLVAIGLFYKQGYFIQEINQKGQQIPQYKDIIPAKAGLELVTTDNGKPLQLFIPYQDQAITVQIWLYKVGEISLYLLDTNLDSNNDLKTITNRLYDPNPEIRIKQEMILGIGGVKLLHALNLQPATYHLNEGHSAFAAYELAADIMHQQGVAFDEAISQIKPSLVFTNHTVVAAGNDIFGKHQVGANLQTYAEAESLPLKQMLELGSDSQDDTIFSMTNLALNTAGRANTVSKLHHQIARTVWPEYHFHSVTNGVHLPTWIAPNIQSSVPALDVLGLNRLDTQQLWQLHQQNKQELCQFIAEQTGRVFNPEVLTVVWARRFAGYKRANLVLQDSADLKKLIKNNSIQIIFAGKAHPNDEIGQDIIDTINRQIRLGGLEDSVVFLPNYSIDSAKKLVSGADVWLNIPRRSQEASGTSGMKSGANGVLQLSISDGWVDEVIWDNIGWMLPEDRTDEAIYDYLIKQVIPLYLSRDKAGVPQEWVHHMHQTMQIIWQRYSAQRMLKEYQELLYQK